MKLLKLILGQAEIYHPIQALEWEMKTLPTSFFACQLVPMGSEDLYFFYDDW